MSAAQGTPDVPAPGLAAPGLADLFSQFLGVGIMGFGGVLPLARRMLVERTRWLTGAEFNDLLALCQFLPGGNIINMTAAIGLRFRGPLGSLAALAGLMAAPVAVIILLGLVYARFETQPIVRRLFAGLAAAAAGLVLATSWKIATSLRRNPAGIAVALACFLAIAVLRLPLLSTMLVLSPISILLAWRIDAAQRRSADRQAAGRGPA